MITLTSLMATCSWLYKFFPREHRRKKERDSSDARGWSIWPRRISPKFPAPIRFPTRKFGPTISIAFGPELLVPAAVADSFDLSVVAIRLLLFIPVARPGPRPPGARISLGTIESVDACVAAPVRWFPCCFVVRWLIVSPSSIVSDRTWKSTVSTWSSGSKEENDLCQSTVQRRESETISREKSTLPTNDWSQFVNHWEIFVFRRREGKEKRPSADRWCRRDSIRSVTSIVLLICPGTTRRGASCHYTLPGNGIEKQMKMKEKRNLRRL